MATLSQEKAKDMLLKRKVILREGIYQLEIKTISEEVFPTTLLDNDGNIIYRRLVNFNASNGHRKNLPEVQAAGRAGDFLTVLNKTQLVGSILTNSSKADQIYVGALVTASIEFPQGENKAGQALNNSIANVTIKAVIQPPTPIAMADHWNFGDATSNEDAEIEMSEEERAALSKIVSIQNAASEFAETPPASTTAKSGKAKPKPAAAPETGGLGDGFGG